MRISRVFQAQLLLIFLLWSSLAGAASFTGKVVKVTDGDTIQVMRDGKAEKIRLAGIDCPEKNQAFGQAATKYTLSLAAQEIVTVQVETTDRYGRLVGEVILPDGKNLNRELVRAGYGGIANTDRTRPSATWSPRPALTPAWPLG